MNSNVGAAAGGHAAIKLGEDVFHYQFFPDERFLLVRESWDHFRLTYNSLLNRTIFSARIPVSGEAWRRLKARFTETLATQQSDLFRERLLRYRLELLDGLAATDGRIAIGGYGLFDDQNGKSLFGRELRTFINETMGDDFLALQQIRTDRRSAFLLETLNEAVTDPAEIVTVLDELSGLFKKRAALSLLLNDTALSSTALLGTKNKIRLDRKQLNLLSNLLASRMKIVASLLGSSRSDSGEALILEIARCHAIHRSIEQEVLLTLDPFPAESPTAMFDRSDQGAVSYLESLSSMLKQKTVLLLDRLHNLSGTESALGYTALENINGRCAELSSVLETGGPVRLASDYMAPSRTGTIILNTQPLGRDVIAAVRSFLSGKRQTHGTEIARHYSYHLLTKNCVSDLQRTVNRSFSGPEESRRSLGGWIDPVAHQVVIPYGLFFEVKKRYRVDRVDVYPARRLAALAALPADESGIERWLREGNSITSTVYERRGADTPFLFFTDDIVWARPPLGLINLAWAALHTLGGIVYVPAAGSDHLWQGIRGIFYSLPELLFFNIRKGSYDYEDLSPER